jgi:hypothetical protein
MMGSNKKTEEYLNQFYADAYSEEQTVDLLLYLTNKNRAGGHTTEKTIRHYHNNHMIGTLIKKYDSVAFECAKSDLNLK